MLDVELYVRLVSSCTQPKVPAATEQKFTLAWLLHARSTHILHDALLFALAGPRKSIRSRGTERQEDCPFRERSLAKKTPWISVYNRSCFWS
jgi:hypothetical protein